MSGTVTSDPSGWFFPQTGLLSSHKWVVFSWCLKEPFCRFLGFFSVQLSLPRCSFLWILAILVSLDPQLYPLNSGRLPACTWVPFSFSLVWKLSKGSGLLHWFSVPQGSLCFVAWYPVFRKLFFDIFCLLLGFYIMVSYIVCCIF